MAKLKISTVDEDKPIILKIRLSTAVHREVALLSLSL
jgi:hypothetical protein